MANKIKFESKRNFDYSSISLSEGLMINEAFRRNIKVSKLIGKYRILEYKGKKHIINSQETDIVGRVPVEITTDKLICKRFLEGGGISVPKGEVFSKNELTKASKFFKSLKKPVVCKPLNADYGLYVFLNIDSLDEFKKRFKFIANKGYDVLVEEYFEGKDYRIFATEKGFIAAAKRIPANVIGDGKHTIRELVKIKNKSKLKKWKNKLFYVGEIRLDAEVSLILKKQGIKLSSVMDKGKRVFLRNNANISTGGESIDMTKNIHPSIKKIAKNTLKSIPSIKYAGIDILTKKKLTEKHSKDDYVIIEVNNMPGLTSHYFPIKGEQRKICSAILDMIFPESKK